MQENILETIKQIEHEKRGGRVVPSYAVCFEVCQRLRLEKSVLLCEL
jgi:DNA-binding XRE family transcriptional regulator